ncbi:2-dehydropantoate 2-reductase [Pseudoclavibacter sp. JSM 162008]|uniref:2-dehydropantoate 2-reductase n=1 Tax=Pseudoclavibacter sp. JSM 162008 TaxID=3229855 RepID=UPI00352424FF
MRVAVIGAGAVGGTLALLLDRAGHEVVLVERDDARVSPADRRHLVLTGAFGTHDAELATRRELSGAFDLILVAVKAQDTVRAVEPHLEAVARAVTVVVQNGLEGASTVERMLTSIPEALRSGFVAGGLATFAVNRPSSDEVRATAAGSLTLGTASSADAPRLAQLAADLSPAIEAPATDDLASALWSKLLINQVNALPAITGLSVQEVGEHPTLLSVLAASMGELLTVAAASGAIHVEVGPFDAALASLANSQPREPGDANARNERLARELSAAFGPTPNYASTLQSIRRGEATEIDALNGAVVAHGRALGLPAPVNATLAELVHDIERGQPHFSPSAVHSSTVTAAINAWFDRGHRALAWRLPTTTPWGVLVSETMLQQTQAARVEPKWLDFIDRWPTPAAMASASEAEVLRFWDRLGYPRRALWLLACARSIVADHAGAVPRTREELLALPGVGPYTASAVMSFAYGVPEPVVDTNVRRVLARAFGGVETPWGPSAVRDATEMRAVSPADPDAANAWNAAAMELGAVVCTAKRPKCEECPVMGLCAWFRAGRPASNGAARKRQATFAGSDREMRGLVLRELRSIPGGVEIAFLQQHLAPSGADADRFTRAIASLKSDGLIVEREAAEIALAGD